MSIYHPGARTAAPPGASSSGPPVAEPSAPFVTVPFLLGLLRRRWRSVAGGAAVGFAAAMVMSLVVSPMDYTASTTLLLARPSETAADSTKAMVTDTTLVKSRSVAQRAIAKLGRPMAVKDLLAATDVTAVSDDVVQITVTGPSGTEAVTRARALAQAFLDFRAEQFRRQSDAVVHTLEEQMERLRADLAVVNGKIDEFGAAARAAPTPSSPQGVADLVAERASIADDLAQLSQQVDDSRLKTERAIGSTSVVDPARQDDRSALGILVTNSLAGILAGAAVVGGVLIMRELSARRVHRRADVTAAGHIPVAVSVRTLGGLHRWWPRGWERQLHAPGPDLVKIVRHVRRSLLSSRTSKPSLIVVSIHSDLAAALTVAATAMELVRQGSSVLVADICPARPLAVVLGISTHKDSVVPVPGGEAALRVTFPEAPGDGAHRDLDGLARGAEVVLVLATVDPAVGARHLEAWAGAAVPVVTVGRSTTTAVWATAQLLADASISVCGAVLVGTDPRDESVGISAPTSAQDSRPRERSEANR